MLNVTALLVRLGGADSMPARLVRRILVVYQGFAHVGRRSMQLFTPTGRYMLWAYVATLLFVVDTRLTMNYQLFSLLLTLLIVSFCISRIRRTPSTAFTVRREVPQVVTAAEPLSYTLVLRNNGDKEQRSLALLESLEPEHALARDWDPMRLRRGLTRVQRAWAVLEARQWGGFSTVVKEVGVPDIPAHGEARVRISLEAPRRGVLHFKESALAVPDPLGLFRGMLPLRSGEKVLVLPRRYELPALELPGGRRRQPGGIRLASQVGERGEFTSLREYRRGDPLRHIHWRSWARHGKPIVMEFQEEFFTRHALILDTFPRQDRMPLPEDIRCFEEAVSMASSFAAMERSRDSLLDLLFVGAQAHCVTSGRGLGDTGHMLEILAGAAPCLDRSFSELAAVVAGHASRVSGCICIFLGYDEERRALVRSLLENRVEVLCLVLVTGEHPPLHGEDGPGFRMRVMRPSDVEDIVRTL